MADGVLTTTSCLAICVAPRERQVVTITGSICGVIPTATETLKSKASSHAPFIVPLTINTMGHITSINTTKTFETDARPTSKLVLVAGCRRRVDIRPTYVLSPVATTTAVALPDCTVVPAKRRFVHSESESG